MLITNTVRPILMIAFTNHALDHMLCSAIDANITKKIVRLGSRSSDTRIQEFNIEAMEQVAGKSRLDRAFSHNHREVKDVETRIKDLMQECLDTRVTSDTIMQHLELGFPVQFNDLLQPPPWVSLLFEVSRKPNEGWTQVGRGGRDEEKDNTIYAYWLRGADIDFLDAAHFQQMYAPPPEVPAAASHPSAPPPANRFEVLAGEAATDGVDADESISVTSSDIDIDEIDLEDVPPEEQWMYIREAADEVTQTRDEASPVNRPSPPVVHPPQAPPPAAAPVEPPTLSSQEVHPSDFMNLQEFFSYFGYQTVPPAPNQDRPLAQLVESDEEVWTLSRAERLRFHSLWIDEVRIAQQENRISEYERLQKMHADAIKNYDEGRAQARCELLRNVDIIGCTTTGGYEALLRLPVSDCVKGAANLTSLLEVWFSKV